MKDWSNLLNHERQELNIEGVQIVVEPGVFTPDPKISYSASVIIDNLPELNGLCIADVGTGSGVIAIISALRGAKKVVATDISESAINNAIENISVNKVGDKTIVVKTNILDGIEENFDLICANLPILDGVWKIDTKSVFEEFLVTAKSYLNPGGRIYLSWSSFADKLMLEKLIKSYGYSFEVVTVEKLGYTWYLYKLF